MTVDVVAEPDIDSHFFKIHDRFFLNGAFTGTTTSRSWYAWQLTAQLNADCAACSSLKQ